KNAGPGAFVDSLYQNLLLRNAEPAAEAAWIAAISGGASPMDVVAGILNSGEYHALILQVDFEDYLNREPDSAAKATLGGWLDLGVSEEVIKTTILASDEFVGASEQAAIDQAMSDPTSSNVVDLGALDTQPLQASGSLDSDHPFTLYKFEVSQQID